MHMKVLGDWTGDLQTLIRTTSDKNEKNANNLIANIENGGIGRGNGGDGSVVRADGGGGGGGCRCYNANCNCGDSCTCNHAINDNGDEIDGGKYTEQNDKNAADNNMNNNNENNNNNTYQSIQSSKSTQPTQSSQHTQPMKMVKMMVNIEGPFGLPSIDMSGHYDVYLLVAGGIGKTFFNFFLFIDFIHLFICLI